MRCIVKHYAHHHGHDDGNERVLWSVGNPQPQAQGKMKSIIFTGALRRPRCLARKHPAWPRCIPPDKVER